MSAPDSIFVRACRREPVPYTPVWLMRQAGRYMPEYRAIRAKHSLLDICKTPEIAAEVTITAAERLNVDAAIIFADLLLPLEVMGLSFEFTAGEGPQVHTPVRTSADIDRLVTYRAAELNYVAESVRLVSQYFGSKLPMIGFCGAPFTLASYMIEGGGSRNYIETKKLMYRDQGAWTVLMEKLVHVLTEYGIEQVRAGADAFQVFDSWVGCLSPHDYNKYVLPHTKALIQRLKHAGVPVIYFGTDSATLLTAMRETNADVIGLDWRIELRHGWDVIGHNHAVQGNLDPVVLFAEEAMVRQQARAVLDQAHNRPGHIFNLGHGILQHTPVENVIALVDEVHEYSSRQVGAGARG
jgi:uroporphyrinogen decarboxylase